MWEAWYLCPKARSRGMTISECLPLLSLNSERPCKCSGTLTTPSLYSPPPVTKAPTSQTLAAVTQAQLNIRRLLAKAGVNLWHKGSFQLCCGEHYMSDLAEPLCRRYTRSSWACILLTVCSGMAFRLTSAKHPFIWKRKGLGAARDGF